MGVVMSIPKPWVTVSSLQNPTPLCKSQPRYARRPILSSFDAVHIRSTLISMYNVIINHLPVICGINVEAA